METVVAVQHKPMFRYLPSIKTVLVNLGLISAGSLIFAIGINGIMIPQGFVCGGLTGASMLVHYFFPSMEMGWAFFLFNIPLLMLGWRNINFKFMAYTLFGTIFFSLTAVWVHPKIPAISDPLLAAVVSGAVFGVGYALILRSEGSGGGFDILGILLNRKYGFQIGTLIFVANGSVLLLALSVMDFQGILYSVVSQFVMGRVADSILSGFDKKKSLIVISDRAKNIATNILGREKSGVTYLKGEGGFSGIEKNVIFAVTPITDLPGIKRRVMMEYPDAFMVVADAREVLGRRYKTSI